MKLMAEASDLVRLRAEYADRERRLAESHLYSLFNHGALFAFQQRQRAALEVLRQAGTVPLGNKRILEVGCGGGGVLLEFLAFGADPSHLHGIDLLADRLTMARHRLPYVTLLCANGQHLPYASCSFDLVLQYTALSSILDDSVKTDVAQEMRRVLRPDGLILWYDFWLNPTNPQTRGIRPPEIRLLFPGCDYGFHRITLAPPIARRLASRSWLLCSVLERLRVFNTHYLVAIRPA
jgi:SAM-dependent methyltransferase